MSCAVSAGREGRDDVAEGGDRDEVGVLEFECLLDGSEDAEMLRGGLGRQ